MVYILSINTTIHPTKKICINFINLIYNVLHYMNPCSCGYYNHPEKECVCGPGVVQRYLNKISGPLLDRIDIHIEVTPVSFDELANSKNEWSEPVTVVLTNLKTRYKNKTSELFEALYIEKKINMTLNPDSIKDSNK